MTETETAWLAGLLEGEGCFGPSGGGPTTNGCCIRVAMTDKDVIEKVARIMGGKIYILKQRNNWKQAWQTAAYGDSAVEIMKAILPFMGERRSARIRGLLDKASRRMSGRDIAVRYLLRGRARKCRRTLSLC